MQLDKAAGEEDEREAGPSAVGSSGATPSSARLSLLSTPPTRPRRDSFRPSTANQQRPSHVAPPALRRPGTAEVTRHESRQSDGVNYSPFLPDTPTRLCYFFNHHTPSLPTSPPLHPESTLFSCFLRPPRPAWTLGVFVYHPSAFKLCYKGSGTLPYASVWCICALQQAAKRPSAARRRRAAFLVAPEDSHAAVPDQLCSLPGSRQASFSRQVSSSAGISGLDVVQPGIGLAPVPPSPVRTHSPLRTFRGMPDPSVVQEVLNGTGSSSPIQRRPQTAPSPHDTTKKAHRQVIPTWIFNQAIKDIQQRASVWRWPCKIKSVACIWCLTESPRLHKP